MQVLSVASEVFPLVKTGGLADVAGALPIALGKRGISVKTLIPGYPAVMRIVDNAVLRRTFPDLLGAEARILEIEHKGLDLLILDCPELFDRQGLYGQLAPFCSLIQGGRHHRPAGADG